VRGVLASQERSESTLQECDHLLSEARMSASAMQGLAEIEGDSLKIIEAKKRVEREVLPLSKEVERALRVKSGKKKITFSRKSES